MSVRILRIVYSVIPQGARAQRKIHVIDAGIIPFQNSNLSLSFCPSTLSRLKNRLMRSRLSQPVDHVAGALRHRTPFPRFMSSHGFPHFETAKSRSQIVGGRVVTFPIAVQQSREPIVDGRRRLGQQLQSTGE